MAGLVTERGEHRRHGVDMMPRLRISSIVKGPRSLATTTVCDDASGTAESNRIAADRVAADLPASVQLHALTPTQGEVILSG